MALISATPAEYAAFLTKYGFSLPSGEPDFLPLSFTFLSTLPFCEGFSNVSSSPEILEAQMFIAYAMSSAGGGFSPVALADSRTVVEESIGRNALVEKYSINETLIGTDPMSMLRSVPMALGLLDSLLCPVPAADEATTFRAAAFVV